MEKLTLKDELDEKQAQVEFSDVDCDKAQLEAEAETLKNKIAAQKHDKEQAEQESKAEFEAKQKEIELERQCRREQAEKVTKTIVAEIDEQSALHPETDEETPIETPEERKANHLRLSRLVSDVGLEILRDVFKHKWDQDHRGCKHPVKHKDGEDEYCMSACIWDDNDLCGNQLLQELKAGVPDKKMTMLKTTQR